MLFIVTEPHGITETPVQRTSERLGHIQKAYSKLIVLDPSNDCLLDFHGLCLVGKLELQPQTRLTREGGRSFDPTALQRQVHEHLIARPPACRSTTRRCTTTRARIRLGPVSLLSWKMKILYGNFISKD